MADPIQVIEGVAQNIASHVRSFEQQAAQDIAHVEEAVPFARPVIEGIKAELARLEQELGINIQIAAPAADATAEQAAGHATEGAQGNVSPDPSTTEPGPDGGAGGPGSQSDPTGGTGAQSPDPTGTAPATSESSQEGGAASASETPPPAPGSGV